MANDNDNAGEGRAQAFALLARVVERFARRDRLKALSKGVTIHAVEQSLTFGDGRSLQGNILIEHPDGTIERIDGKQLAELNERFPEFFRRWRLGEDDGM